MRQRKLRPLEQWVCDTCGDVIEQPSDGWLEWVRNDADGRVGGFRVVHHYKASPRRSPDPNVRTNGCYRDPRELPLDLHLHHVLERGIVHVLSELDLGDVHDPNGKHPGVTSIREWANLMRRLFVPFYEQARFFFAEEQRDEGIDDNEVALYESGRLERIIDKYVDAAEDDN